MAKYADDTQILLTRNIKKITSTKEKSRNTDQIQKILPREWPPCKCEENPVHIHRLKTTQISQIPSEFTISFDGVNISSTTNVKNLGIYSTWTDI